MTGRGVTGRGPSSLAVRMALLTTAIAVITALVAGSVGIGLIRRGSNSNAQKTLANLADATKVEADAAGSAQLNQLRARATLRALKVQFAAVNARGAVTGDTALARAAVTPADVQALLDGRSISGSRTVEGVPVFVEGRPTAAGGLVLIQRRRDATAVGDQAVGKLLVALLIAVAIAVVIGLVVAWRLARPLRRTADAAHALAGGRRDVALVPEGPAEVAEVANAVNTLAAGLAQSEGRQREFLLSVSHDLRTPLTAIGGYAESLADGTIPPEQAAHAGSVILAESQRLNRLVGDLLDLARLNAQEFRVDLVDIDVIPLIVAAAQVWRARCESVGVRFFVEYPQGLLLVRTDATRLRQLLDGLFDNALRVTPAGAPIVLAARRESGSSGQLIAIEVRDGGPGLSDDDLGVAFDRSALYERYRGQRHVGTGLGLAIVHGLAERLGAGIEAGHATEGGARFTLRLPALD